MANENNLIRNNRYAGRTRPKQNLDEDKKDGKPESKLTLEEEIYRWSTWTREVLVKRLDNDTSVATDLDEDELRLSNRPRFEVCYDRYLSSMNI